MTARQRWRERRADATMGVGNSSLSTGVSVLVNDNPSGNSAPNHRLSLEDLLAKHPNHNLFIFSDASSFFSPLTGKLHSWVEAFSQWTFRALLVPERMLAFDINQRTRILRDAGFLLLSATEKGLSVAVDVLDGGDAKRADFVSSTTDSVNEYPDLLNGDDLNWLSDLPPRPSKVSLLIAQLHAYLGQDTFEWLCACAVYPELLWDLTLYLGNELRVLGPDEQRLGLLLRLPWFRHGSMPDWLRNRLVSVMAPAEQEAVRDALWRLLDTALNRPIDGFELSYAKDEKAKPAVWARLRARWLRRLLLNFIRTEQPANALRDYVFLSVLRGRKPGKGLTLPARLHRLWGRFGQPGLPVIQIVSGVLATIVVSGAMYHYRPAAPPPREVQLPQGSYPLPTPTGSLPYHLSLDQIASPALIKSAEGSGTLVFQVAGDTGGVKDPTPQKLVAEAMESQFGSFDSADDPAFLYLLGDLIYYNGESKDYYAQFYEPYRKYPAPIVAIPGNHDGDPVPGTQTLEAFMRNFCALDVHHTTEAGDVNRTAMRQPNPYWTLDTPFATIIGLYTNVPNEGFLDNSQQAWLVSELKNAPANKALIVALHHPVYSIANAGGSGYLAGVLDHAMVAAGRAPDLVLSAHANNYQRFTRVLGSGSRSVSYVVNGGGGYFNLARVPTSIKAPLVVSRGVTLNAFDDTHHGFLRLTATRTQLKGEYSAAAAKGTPTQVVDAFTIALREELLPERPKVRLAPDLRPRKDKEKDVQGSDRQTPSAVPTGGQKSAPGTVVSSANHLGGTIVPPPANWAAFKVTVDGSSATSSVDSMGHFVLTIDAANGDRVLLKVYDGSTLVYADFQALPGPITIALPQKAVPETNSSVQQGPRPEPQTIRGRVTTVDGEPVSQAQISISGGSVEVTTDSGEFEFSSPGLKVGNSVTFAVKGWVILSPCVSESGRTFVPTSTDPISIKVIRPGDQRLRSAISSGSRTWCTMLPVQAPAPSSEQNAEFLSPDGRWLASVEGGAITVLDKKSGREVGTWKGDAIAVGSLAWSPDGKMLASAGYGTVKLWDIPSLKEIRQFQGDTGMIGNLAWSPDGRLLASGGYDGTIRVLEASTGRELYVINERVAMRSLTWSPDSKQLQSITSDGATRFWDAVTGREIYPESQR